MNETIALVEVAQIVAGQHIEANLHNGDALGIPYLTGPADFGDITPKITKWTSVPKVFASSDDVLVTVKGAGVGKSNLGCDAAIGRQLMALRPIKGRIIQSYLFHFIRSQEGRIAQLADGATVPGLGKNDLETLRLPSIPLAEQQRIAAILDKADALRRKRKRSIELLDRLAHSKFSETFVSDGDPEWSIASVEELAIDIRTGPFGSQLLHSEFVDQGVAVLGIDNVVDNEFRWGERRFISETKYAQLKRYRVRPGDVLITIMGTCGRCAIVPDDIPIAINTKHLCCITLNKDKCLPEFLKAAFLHHPMVLKQLGVQAKGAVMPGLNMGIIKSFSFPLPPIELQAAFVGMIHRLRSIRSQQLKGKADLDLLFSSLQHRAFSGQL